jgi:polysaccharide chain length determinant protein (PEP-CTERM system associated)
MDQMLRMILDELRGAWRFRWPAMALAWVVAVAGTIVVLALPDLYEARAQVFLDTSDPLVQDTRATDADMQVRVAFVRQTLLSTPNIERVARATDLDLRAATPDEFERLVTKLQRDITVRSGAESVRRGATRFQSNLYNISYRDPSRAAAERVVQTLLNTFQEQSLESDLRDDMQALRFLDSQVDTYRQRLEQSEAAMSDFRRRHGGLLPGDTGGFFGRLATLQEELRQVRADLQIAIQRRATLAAQVQAAGSGEESGAGSSLVEMENQVLQVQRELDELRLRYTDVHPSVTSAEERLRALQQRLDDRRAELGPIMDTGATGGEVVANVRIALSQAEVQVTELRSRERDLMARIGELQEQLDIAPQLEAELAGLTRDYQVLRSQYESLLQRRELMNFEIDRKRQGKQMEFRIIEPPIAPQLPVAPQRGRLLLLVLVAGLLAGAGLSYLLHVLRPVFGSGHAIYEQLGIPVLGTVSMTWTPTANWRRRRAEWAFLAALFAMIGMFGALFSRLPEITGLVQRLMS